MSLSEITSINPLFPEQSMKEIDLLSMLEQLYIARKKIAIITVVFALLGCALSYVFPQKWTSQAVITPLEQE